MQTHAQPQTSTKIFTAVLLHNSLKLKNKNPKCPSIVIDIFTIGIPHSNENEQITVHETAWLTVVNITFGQRSKTENSAYFMIPFV